MSVRDGQWLRVFDSVSVTFMCLVPHIHSELCRLGYRLAGSHVKSSVTVLHSSFPNCNRGKLIIPIAVDGLDAFHGSWTLRLWI